MPHELHEFRRGLYVQAMGLRYKEQEPTWVATAAAVALALLFVLIAYVFDC